MRGLKSEPKVTPGSDLAKNRRPMVTNFYTPRSFTSKPGKLRND